MSGKETSASPCLDKETVPSACFEVITLNEKVDKQIEDLPTTIRVKMLQNMELLSEFGNELREPFSKGFGDGLFELRTKGKEGIARAFYTFRQDKIIVIFSVFIKKSQKTPKGEIDKARKILKSIKEEL